MKKTHLLIIIFLSQVLSYTAAQPHPSDRGPGTPGGDPFGSPPLGAPVDDFILGLILFSLLYGYYKWHKSKKQELEID